MVRASANRGARETVHTDGDSQARARNVPELSGRTFTEISTFEYLRRSKREE